jgi:hypothetical protein
MGPFILIALLCFGSDAEAQNRKVRICVPGVGSGFMHAYLAKERGYFRQEGLDVDILVARGQICTMALISGQMELTTNPNVFDAMVAGKFRGKVIYVTAKSLGHRFIVAPDDASEGDCFMVMMERFGSPATRLMSVMKSFQVPVRSIQPGDRILVITDDAMDPLVWQGAMAAINEKGGEPVLCMWPRLDHHFADPPQMAIEAARGADRGKIVSVLRLEGIIEKITMIIDDTVVCDNGKILV